MMQRSVPTTAAMWPSRDLNERRSDVRLFGPFRLDVGEQRLWKGDKELTLRRKPFAILRFMTENPLRLATQEEIVEAVWGKIAMCESLLRTQMSEVRRVLGEGVIETVVGRGYRFLLGVEAETVAIPSSRQVEMPRATTRLVGRDGEMAVLRSVFERALQETRQTVFVTGEPGVGKTGLTDAFLAEVAVPNGALVARGSCVEQLGTGEAYLPVLNALGAVCRGPDGERIVELLARHAPTWLAQMPGLVQDEDLQGLLLRIQGATPGRMLREFAEAFDVFATDKPFVLVLEDLQWADHSTIDLIAALGARREPSRAVVLVTCRPAELERDGGLAKTIVQLGAHKQAVALRLESWPVGSVAEYLSLRFSSPRLTEQLAGTIHGMTGGNPLFTVAVVDDLESRGTIRHVDGAWQLTASVAEVASRRPDTVRQFIDIQIDRLNAVEQRILEAASTIGPQFAVGVVAHALALAADDVDAVCERLSNQGRFLSGVTTETWPDGTPQSNYSFVHALYRDAALARAPSGIRRVWHRRVAEGVPTAPVALGLPPRLDQVQPFGLPARNSGGSRSGASGSRGVTAPPEHDAEVA
jgi:DNA-binding winged helix-turn-helix (wHTH) protein